MRHAYNFSSGLYKNKFLFTSKGSKGDVRKAVVFEFEEDGLYSLILGDLNDKNQMLNFTLTGNDDAKKVLSTVAAIIEYFLAANPKAIIFFTGNTRRLTNFYKKLLLAEAMQLPEYIIEGVKKDNTCEPLKADNEYEGYFIFRKKIGSFIL